VWVELDVQAALPASLRLDLARLPGVQRVEGEATTWVVQVGGEAEIPDLIAWFVSHNARLTRVMPRRHTLEEIYFQLQETPAGRPV